MLTISMEPEVFVFQGYVIETYPTIADVPYASVSEQRGRTPKTSENERFDELYGRCRTCMGHKSGEQLLLCDDCDRGFHMTCLVPVLGDVPKGEWHCPKCTRDRRYSIHARAAAVVNLRKVLNDIQTRASLPLKVQLKYLDIASPTVKCTRVSATTQSTSQQLQNTTPKPISRRAWKALPPKCRVKRQCQTRNDTADNIPSPEDAEASVVCKKITTKSVQKRIRSLSRLTSELIPITDRLDDKALTSRLKRLQSRLKRTKEDTDAGVAATRTSHNALSRAKKRQRLDITVPPNRICQCVGQCSCANENHYDAPRKGIRPGRETKLQQNGLPSEDPESLGQTHARVRQQPAKG